MRGARHPALSVAVALVAAALLVSLASGCGSSSGTKSSGEGSAQTAAPQGATATVCGGTPVGVGTLRVTGIGCATGRKVAGGWTAKSTCAAPAGTSRTSCKVGAYRCLGTATGHGLAVNCARPGRSISFVARRS